jgi:nicotinamide-nucleotide adenylyltransferase
MIDLAMREAGITRARTVTIPDIHNHAIWAGYVVSLCPPFDVVVAHNPVTLELFREEGFEVREVPLHSRSRYSGTRVRRLMAAGDGRWEGLVPPAVARYISDIDGDGRMRRMAESPAGVAPRHPQRRVHRRRHG